MLSLMEICRIVKASLVSTTPAEAFQIARFRGSHSRWVGVDIDEARAARYPYERAYLPMNRREDGTMHSW
jgi:mannonate dehydratase